MTTPLSRDLKLEEFSQLYRQIRSYEQGLVTVLNVCVVASTTLLSAIFAFFSNIYQTHPETVTVPFCYLFLAPAVLIILSVYLMSSYRIYIYRTASYIQVFFEEVYGGAQWGASIWSNIESVSRNLGIPGFS